MCTCRRWAVCGARIKDSLNTGAGGMKASVATRIICRLRNFQGALEALIDMSRNKRIAIMCAEAAPWRCHRSLVADALSAHGVPVVEILSGSTYRMHKF